jgi:hypothetical protein
MMIEESGTENYKGDIGRFIKEEASNINEILHPIETVYFKI